MFPQTLLLAKDEKSTAVRVSHTGQPELNLVTDKTNRAQSLYPEVRVKCPESLVTTYKCALN